VPRRERNEKQALKIVGICFLWLAPYIAYLSATDLWSERASDHSIPGILLACVSLVVMPAFAREAKSGRLARHGFHHPESGSGRSLTMLVGALAIALLLIPGSARLSRFTTGSRLGCCGSKHVGCAGARFRGFLLVQGTSDGIAVTAGPFRPGEVLKISKPRFAPHSKKTCARVAIRSHSPVSLFCEVSIRPFVNTSLSFEHPSQNAPRGPT
jgi:hypothetical protein